METGRHVQGTPQLAGLIQRASSVSLCSSSLHPNFFFSFLHWLFICFHLPLALGIRLTSIYTLRCCGDTASWDIFTSLLVPAPCVPHSFSSPALSSSAGALCRLPVVAYFLHVAINSPTGLVSTLNVICTLTAVAVKCFQEPGSR